jgi:hypothetical protein
MLKNFPETGICFRPQVEFLVIWTNFMKLVSEGDRLCGLVVRVPGYTTEMYEYCDFCEVRTEFIYVT